MSSDVYLLVGFPGTGKYTVAKALVAELERRGAATRMVDSHYVNNPVFGVIKRDGINPLDDRVWDLVTQVREAVLTAIEQLSDPAWSFVFTNFITTEEVTGYVADYLERLRRLAADRGGRFHVITLTCEVEELCRRIVRPDRAERMKSLNAEQFRQQVGQRALHSDPEGLTLDVTDLTPDEAALRILEHADRG